MEMIYRGVRYQYNPTSVQISKGKNDVNFLKYRGCSYQLNNNYITLPKFSCEKIIYRGISVSTGQNIHFLGRTCQQKKLFFQSVMG
jgi:hypothetical protein